MEIIRGGRRVVGGRRWAKSASAEAHPGPTQIGGLSTPITGDNDQPCSIIDFVPCNNGAMTIVGRRIIHTDNQWCKCFVSAPLGISFKNAAVYFQSGHLKAVTSFD